MLSLAAEHALAQDNAPQPQRLNEAIAGLYATAPGAPITLVLESAWLPVMLVDTGPTLLRAAQVEVLARHRFGLQYSDGADPVAGWELRIEQRAGSRQALAYGLPPRLKQTLVDAARTLGLEWAALTPGLAWGMERLRPARAWPRSVGWWLWPEQDRTLVARIESGAVVGLDAGAPPATDEPDLLRLVEAGGVRFGIESTTDPVAAATWHSVPHAARVGRINWLDVRTQDGLPSSLGHATSKARATS